MRFASSERILSWIVLKFVVGADVSANEDANAWRGEVLFVDAGEVGDEAASVA